MKNDTLFMCVVVRGVRIISLQEEAEATLHYGLGGMNGRTLSDRITEGVRNSQWVERDVVIL
jgi:hypothetical protein